MCIANCQPHGCSIQGPPCSYQGSVPWCQKAFRVTIRRITIRRTAHREASVSRKGGKSKIFDTDFAPRKCGDLNAAKGTTFRNFSSPDWKNYNELFFSSYREKTKNYVSRYYEGINYDPSHETLPTSRYSMGFKKGPQLGPP